jgi:asparaginyl-tRNA synthetase
MHVWKEGSAMSSSSSRTPIRTLLATSPLNQEVTVKGWVRSLRKSKTFGFLSLNDGSCFGCLQAVIDDSLPNNDEVFKLLTGASVAVTGIVVPSQGKGQSIELQAKRVEIIGQADETFPLQKKATTLEFLREHAHLRVRTNTFGAVFRVRHALAFATHRFFHERGFYYMNAPIITGSDCEGAGEMFRVTTLPLDALPRTTDGQIEFAADYFGRATNLTVSGQLEAECHALGLGAVYTFGPTFRSENSNTTRHLSEFWMIEPEVAFADLDEVATLATDYLKYMITFALDHCAEDLDFLQQRYQPGLRAMLELVRDAAFVKITYSEAIAILEAAAAKEKFQFPVAWGADIQTEHERYLTEKHFQLPVIVTDYPKAIKAFYMKQNDDGKTVRAMDVLVPGVGEIIGGSQREDDLAKLLTRIREMGLREEDYWWYLDLRRFGSAPHAGFGLGFERAVMYITGMANIRDVIPFPRFPRSADF